MSDGSVRVLDPAGQARRHRQVRDLTRGGANTYGVQLHAGLPDGTYTVAWQAVSADSHPVSGAFTFSVGAPSETTVALPDQEAGGGLVGVLYGIAPLPRLRRVHPARRRRRLRARAAGRAAPGCGRCSGSSSAAGSTLTASTLVLLLLRAPYTGSGKLADVFDLGGLRPSSTPRRARRWSPGCCCSPPPRCSSRSCSGRTRSARTEKREARTSPSDSPSAARSSPSGIAATWAMAEHASTGIQAGVAMPVDVLAPARRRRLAGRPRARCWSPCTGRRIARRRRAAVLPHGVRQRRRPGGDRDSTSPGGRSAVVGADRHAYGQLLLSRSAWSPCSWASPRSPGGGPRGWQRARPATRPWSRPRTAVATGRSVRGFRRSADELGRAGPTPTRPRDGVDPERAAQLARQRAALTTATEKRARDADPDRSGLRRSVLAETGIAVVLLVVTTILTPPNPAAPRRRPPVATPPRLLRR